MDLRFDKKEIVVIGVIIIMLLAWTLGNLSVAYFSMEEEDPWINNEKKDTARTGASPAEYIDIPKMFLNIFIGAIFLLGFIGILISPRQNLREKSWGFVILSIFYLLFMGRDYVGSLIGSIDLPMINFPNFPEISIGDLSEPVKNSQLSSNLSGIGILLVLVAALGITFLIFRHMEKSSEDTGNKEEDISDTADKALEELHEGKDVRDVIIRNYQKMCFILERRGVHQEMCYTPRELENKALNQLRLKKKTIDEMTKLFEEAKYSDHPLKEKERDRAIDNFRQIRDELGSG